MGDLINDTSLPNASLSAVERAIVLCASILMDCMYHKADKTTNVPMETRTLSRMRSLGV